ncbi:MAG: DUF1802 family protein [Mycobacterium sp.]
MVQACPLHEPVLLARTPAYAGCTSWVPLQIDSDWALPVHSDEALAEIAERVRRSVA